MRPILFLLPFLAGCTAASGPALGARFAALTDPAMAQKRGAVELVVKSQFDAIRRDIAMGGGPALTAAFDTAGVPLQDRPARLIQLRSDQALYDANPGALVTTLLIYGG